MINLRNTINTTNPWNIKGSYEKHMQQRRAEMTILLLQLIKPDIVLDVGCGEGFYLSLVHRHVELSIGIDISKEAIIEAKSHINRGIFIISDANRMPFKTKIFDKIYALEILEHLDNPKKCILEIDRLLKSKGTIVLSTPYQEKISYLVCPHCKKETPLWGHYHSFDEEKLTSYLSSSYRNIKIKYIANPAVLIFPFEKLPSKCWDVFNSIANTFFGKIGYWILLRAKKQ